MFTRRLVCVATSVVLAGAIATSLSFVSARAQQISTEPQVIDDATLHAKTATSGGADVLPTTRTVPHWFATTLNPNDGVTYGYNMVGANPYTCSGND